MKKSRILASVAAAAMVATGFVGSVPAEAASYTVTVWSPFSGGNLAMWNAAVARIEARHPNIDVVSVGSKDMEASLLAINANTGPDISVSNGLGNIGWFCGTGAWIDLRTYLNSKNFPLDVNKTFSGAAVRGTSSNGTRCALPFSSEVFGFYYNKSLLAAKKLAVPKTTDDLIRVGKALTTFAKNGDITRAGYVPYAYADYNGFDNGMGSLFLGAQFGAKWFTAGGSPAFNSDPKWAKAFNWQKKYIATVFGGGNFQTGAAKLTKFMAGQGDWWGSNNDFIKGRVAMVAAADWMSMMFCDPDGWNLNPCTTTKAVNFGTAPMPVDTAQYSTLYGSGVVGANAMGISRGSNVKAAAWIVLKELATDKTLSVSWANANGDPASLLAARTASSGVTYPAFYKTFYTISAHRLSGYHELWNTGEHLEEGAVQSFMAAWQAGTIDNLSDGLDELTDEVNNILDDNS